MLLGALPPPNINFQDNSGRTALHWASELGHTSIVRALIAAQPPPNLDLLNKGAPLPSDGKTALQLARNDDIRQAITTEIERRKAR
jgi:ankyrin repeat protein